MKVEYTYLQELIAVLQERLHAHQSVYTAILDTHLQQLLQLPQAFQLVIRSFPANSARQNSFYSKLGSILESGCHEQMIAHDPILVHHVTRELHRLITPGELCSSSSTALQTASMGFLKEQYSRSYLSFKLAVYNLNIHKQFKNDT